MPGSLDSSAARSSIAPTLEGELEWKIQSPRELPHLALGEVRGLFLGFIHSVKHQVLQHLHILRVGNTGIDFDASDGSLAVGFDCHHSAAGSSGDGLFFQFRLHLLHARLHLLRLLENLAEISHWLFESMKEVSRGARDRARRWQRRAPDLSGEAYRCAPPSELRASSCFGSNPVPSLPWP